MLLRTEQTYDYLVARLATIPATISRPFLVCSRYAHLYLPDLVMGF